MRIEPLTPRPPKPAALLIPGHRRLTVVDADGTRTAEGSRSAESLLGSLGPTRTCYVPGALSGLKATTGALSWTAHTWRGRATRYIHNPSATTVSSLRGALDGGDTGTAYEALDTVLSWLAGYGVGPASISSMAWSLWRASLSGPVTLGFDPGVARRAFFGGRQEVRECRTYSSMAAVDLVSAYPSSMAAGPYATSLREVSADSRLDPDVAGIAWATVDVAADMPYAPLPVRLAPDIVSYQTGPVTGVWPWCELVAGANLGCSVTVHRSWAPRQTLDLFGPWWQMAMSGRKALRGPALVLLKAILNSLWGQFAMNGEHRGRTTWADESGEHPVDVELPARSLPQRWTTHVAAETTARVRTRLLTEGIYGGVGYPVHVDTDGVIVRTSRSDPTPGGDQPGQWRRKSEMTRVELRAPQVFRWQCGAGCGITHAKWHYTCAGVPDSAAPALFDRAPSVPIAHRGVFDVQIPTTHSADVQAITSWTSQIPMGA